MTTSISPPHHCSFSSFPFTERPKIWLPRNLRQTIIKKVGDTVNLVIPFQVQRTFDYLMRRLQKSKGTKVILRLTQKLSDS